ncbi:MAG: hypothetical protein MZW92_13655, partial [Comamonadaceae bacterium]|nr:hypothetical protein [Comamonadaceae bacterium]
AAREAMRTFATRASASSWRWGATASAQTAEDQLAQVVAALMHAGWLGRLPTATGCRSNRCKQIRWEALPPKMLDDALPDGSVLHAARSRQPGRPAVRRSGHGRAHDGGQRLSAQRGPGAAGRRAGGARSPAAQGLSLDLARCPVKGSAEPATSGGASRRRASGPRSSIRRPTAMASSARGMPCYSARRCPR